MPSRALKTGQKKSDANQPTPSEAVSEDAVAILAHQLWEKRGCPIGSDQDDWFQAEKQLKARTAPPKSMTA